MRTCTVLLSVCVILLFFQGTMSEQGYSVGDYARDFELKGTDGKMVSMADYPDAKGFVVVFTCNECPYAKAYQERINQINQDYASKGYPVIAINPNSTGEIEAETLDQMKKRAQQEDFTFPYLADETQEITRTYGATNTPHVYVLAKEADNKFKVAYIGTIDNNYKDADEADKHYVREALDALMDDQPVEEAKTKAIGCTIKWKQA